MLSQGIVGNLASGKSALVHRYLTGTYVQEESPEGENIILSVCLYEICLLCGVKNKNPKHPVISCQTFPALPQYEININHFQKEEIINRGRIKTPAAKIRR